jgi:hypothetical protein
MNFSYEELYFMYGQYDRFVQLSFHRDSEADKRIAIEYFMGNFKYSPDEIRSLESLRNQENITRTEKRIRFVPSELHEINDDLRTFLDREGFLCSDICLISARNFPKENRYTVKGEKEIPNTIPITIDMAGIDTDMLTLGMLKSRIREGYQLRNFEWDEYYGLMFYYQQDTVIEKKEIYANYEKKELQPEIKYHFLMTKYLNSNASEDEVKELISLGQKKNKIKVHLLLEEFKRSSEKVKDIAKSYNDTVSLIIALMIRFEDEILVPYQFSIWWDFDRFVHIYLRHVKETQVGERFQGKSIFQYKFKEIKRLISIVVGTIYEEIVEHFKNNPAKVFFRMGERAVHYDGHFYRIDIEPSGRLIEFHPYNDDKERKNDK